MAHSRSQSVKLIFDVTAILLVFIFSILMLNTIKQYFAFRTDVGFLQFKQQVVHNKYWLLFFYIHIFSIITCLLAGITQFSQYFLRNYKKWHRTIGKIYVYNVVFINFPACFVLGMFSNGGYLGIAGFLIQDLLWAIFTISAVYYIRKKNVEKHRRFMMLSYAITTTAITFRIIKNLVFDEKVFSYEMFYGVNVWLSLLVNLLICVIIINYNSKRLSSNNERIISNRKDNSS